MKKSCFVRNWMFFCPQSYSKGFSLVELILVVGLIGILSTLTIPRIQRSIDELKFEDFVKNIYSLSQYLQASSISHEKVYSLNIDDNSLSFWGEVYNGTASERLSGRFSKSFNVPKGVSFVISKKKIYFYPDGSVDQGMIDFENKDKTKISLVIDGAGSGIKIK